jgi:VPS28 protein
VESTKLRVELSQKGYQIIISSPSSQIRSHETRPQQQPAPLVKAVPSFDTFNIVAGTRNHNPRACCSLKTMYPQTRQPAYAPTPYSYTPAANLSATINLDEEVKLPTNASERDLLESLAEIYSIIVTLEALEKAFNKDSVTDAEYTELCNRLLRQYKSNLSDARISREFGDIDTFKSKWGVS